MEQYNLEDDAQLPLTEREKRLLRRLAEQKADGQIASEIGGTTKQIAAQRERLLLRLGISSSVEIERAATLWARWPYRCTGSELAEVPARGVSDKATFQKADDAAELALEFARSLPSGPARAEAIKQAGKLRTEADRLRPLEFARRGRPPK